MGCWRRRGSSSKTDSPIEYISARAFGFTAESRSTRAPSPGTSKKQLKSEPLSIASGLVPPYSKLEVVDDHTIDITLEEPNGVFMNILAAPLLMIVDPARYEELGENYGTRPSGTGPFRFVSWTPDRRVVLEANRDYWNPDGGPGVGELVFEVIPDAAARIIALRNREVDVIFNVPAEEVESLEADPDIKVVSNPTMRIVYVGLNTADPTLSDVRVRRALGHAIDRDQILGIIGSNGVRADGLGTSGALGFGPSAREYDPAEAARLLDDAGWLANGDHRESGGKRLSITVLTAGTSPGEIEAMLVIQSQWKKVGVEMIIHQMESGARFAFLNDEAAKHEADPAHQPRYQAWTAAEGIRTGEIGYITERPKCDQGARGWERFCDPEFDAGFNLSQAPLALEDRLEGYMTVNRVLYESAIRLPVYVIQSHKAMGNHVHGFVPNPNDSLNLRRVSVFE